MAKTKVYAVRKGRKSGIYSSWEEARKQVEGFPDASFKSFTDWEEAKAYLKIPKGSGKHIKVSSTVCKAYVDGSYNKEEGIYGSGIVLLTEKGSEEYMTCGWKPGYADMRNVAGELEAALYAIEKAIEKGYRSIHIYHDYSGVAAWATGEWKANKPGTKEYVNKIRLYQRKISIHFHKVQAHTGDKNNEIADQLAKRASGVSW